MSAARCEDQLVIDVTIQGGTQYWVPLSEGFSYFEPNKICMPFFFIETLQELQMRFNVYCEITLVVMSALINCQSVNNFYKGSLQKSMSSNLYISEAGQCGELLTSLNWH